MPDDAVTLRDTVITPETPADSPADKPADTPADPTPTVQVTADKEAAEIGRILLDSGFSKDQLNDLIDAPKALDAIKFQVINDPAAFLQSLERTNPDAAKNFHERLADLYVERYADKATPANGNGKSGDNELMREIQALKSETNALRTERERERQAAVLAQVQNRYNSRVDDLFGTKEIKELGLTNSEQKALRAQLNTELSTDQNVVKRVSNGNFVDVPKTFKGIIDSWAADKKAAAEAAKGQRDKASNSAFPEFPAGPNPLMVDVPNETFDSWDKTEEALGAALARMAR